MPKTARSGSYTPTTDELKEFINEYLEEVNPRATSKSILAAMKTKKKSWKVPERRVNKMIKKNKSSPNVDDEITETSSIVSNIRKSISKRLEEKKKSIRQSVKKTLGKEYPTKKESPPRVVTSTSKRVVTSSSSKRPVTSSSSSPPRVVTSSSLPNVVTSSTRSSSSTASTSTMSTMSTSSSPKDSPKAAEDLKGVLEVNSQKIALPTKKSASVSTVEKESVTKSVTPAVKNTVVESAPDVKELALELEKKASIDANKETEVKKEVEAETEAEAETNTKIESLEIYDNYVDDNDGKPEPKCCKANDGCVIL